MNAEHDLQSKSLTPQETAATLQRILNAVEQDQRRRWVEIACGTLEWTIEHAAQDSHVLSEVAECHLARGDLKAAEEILERARAAGLTTDAIYTSLVKAHGRSGHPERARLIFERAKADGAVSTFTYPALIAAYAAAGDVTGASRAFEAARADGQLSAPAFTAWASALAGAGDMAAVERVLQVARQSGHMSGRLAYAAIRARLNGHQFGAARRLLEDAKREGMADVLCYQAIIAACHRAGRHREAKRVYASAATDPSLTADDLRRVKSAHQRRGAAASTGASMAA